MPKPTDLYVARAPPVCAEHDAVYGAARDDVTRLFDHYAQKVGECGLTAAILTYTTVIAVPEGEPYE